MFNGDGLNPPKMPSSEKIKKVTITNSNVSGDTRGLKPHDIRISWVKDIIVTTYYSFLSVSNKEPSYKLFALPEYEGNLLLKNNFYVNVQEPVFQENVQGSYRTTFEDIYNGLKENDRIKSEEINTGDFDWKTHSFVPHFSSLGLMWDVNDENVYNRNLKDDYDRSSLTEESLFDELFIPEENPDVPQDHATITKENAAWIMNLTIDSTNMFCETPGPGPLKPPKMVLIPGGELVTWYGITVTLIPYYMDVTEVTVGEFKRVMGIDYLTCESGSALLETDEYPLQCAGFFDAIAYCNARSELEGLEPVYSYLNIYIASDGHYRIESLNANYSKNGYRIPTVNEWDFAAKGDRETVYYWGNDINSFDVQGNGLDDYAWHSGNSGGKPHPVGKGKLPNYYGLYNMFGNLAEFTGMIVSCETGIKEFGDVSGISLTPYDGRFWPVWRGTHFLFDYYSEHELKLVCDAFEEEGNGCVGAFLRLFYSSSHMGFRCVKNF